MAVNPNPTNNWNVDVEYRLSKLGLDSPTLEDVFVAARNHALTLSPYDPPASRGNSVWRHLNRALRIGLVSKGEGWQVSDKSFFAVVLNDDLNIALYILRGDDNTGRGKPVPSNRYRKRDPKKRGMNAAHLKWAIQTNRDSILYDHGNDHSTEWFEAMGIGTSGWTYQTWILLHTVSPSTNDLSEIRAEISMPISMRAGYITEWADRIILPSLDDSRSETLAITPADGGDEGAVVSEVRIAPKQ